MSQTIQPPNFTPIPNTKIQPHVGDAPLSNGFLFFSVLDLKTKFPLDKTVIEPVSNIDILRIKKRSEDKTYSIKRLSCPPIFLNEEALANQEEKLIKAGDTIRFQLSKFEEYTCQFFPTPDLHLSFEQKIHHKHVANDQDSLKDEVICSLCLKCMHRAMALGPCLHSFCSSCLSRHLLDSDSCPVCREKITFVRKNFLLNKLITQVVKNNPDLKISQNEKSLMDKRDSLFHGAEVRRYEDGSFYYGSFEKKKREGKGKFIGADQSVYYGIFKNDKKEGFGECSWADGRVYRGEWKNDKRHGVGEMVWPDGVHIYGFWENDVFHGSGASL